MAPCRRAPTLKVGSSLVKRFSALLKLAVASRDLGVTARDMTGSGTFMLVIVYLRRGLHQRLCGAACRAQAACQVLRRVTPCCASSNGVRWFGSSQTAPSSCQWGSQLACQAISTAFWVSALNRQDMQPPSPHAELLHPAVRWRQART